MYVMVVLQVMPATVSDISNVSTVSYVSIIIKFPYNARSDWWKQRPLSENKVQVNDIES